MVNLERLRSGGIRAYEFGRLRSAARAAWILIPTTIVCAIETGSSEVCACIGVLLLGVAIFFRWRNRQGSITVRNGLIAGGAPLIAGLFIARLAPSCVGAPLASLCTAVCLVIGSSSGVWLGIQIAQRRSGAANWLTACGISVLAASLGCVRLGVAGVLGVAIGVLMGSAASVMLSKQTPA